MFLVGVGSLCAPAAAGFPHNPKACSFGQTDGLFVAQPYCLKLLFSHSFWVAFHQTGPAGC